MNAGDNKVAVLVRSVRMRMRLQRAINGALALSIASAVFLALLQTAIRFQIHGLEGKLPWLLALSALFPIVGALLGAARPIPFLQPAMIADYAMRLSSRLANAMEFLRLKSEERSPFMVAAIEDAAHRSISIRPNEVLPFRAPKEILISLACAILGVVALRVWPVSARKVQHKAEAQKTSTLVLRDDDVGALRERAQELSNAAESNPRIQMLASEYNQLIEDLANRRLTRAETMRRIAALEKRMMDASAGDARKWNDTLRQMGQGLQASKAAQKVSEALRNANARVAADQLRALSEQMRNSHMSREELNRLRDALSKASRDNQSALSRQLERRRQELERLLERERQAQKEQPQTRLLNRRQRELERLEREQQSIDQQRRQLERLRREWQRAAEDLRRNQSNSASEALERSAEDLNRLAEQQLSQEQQAQLQRELEQLREMIRRYREQGGNNGQQQNNGQGQMQRFTLRARGQSAGQGTPLLMPNNRSGNQGESGEENSGNNPNQNQNSGQDGQKALMLDPRGGGAQIQVPGLGGRMQMRSMQTSSSSPGHSHNPNMLDNPTQIDAEHQNVRVQGAASEEGGTRSEVILGGATRGFASRGYKRVYVDYLHHAEEVLEKEDIPPGYRFYVRRYFQLIRPREEPPQ